ncbi:hypothetical protein Avbf_14870 [Armadillidium vulgare]|nr:hypothetical protein Avbf_14870 [Armadillidium vulgare]
MKFISIRNEEEYLFLFILEMKRNEEIQNSGLDSKLLVKQVLRYGGGLPRKDLAGERNSEETGNRNSVDLD